MKEKLETPTAEKIMYTFVDQVMDNFHIILSMSPIGGGPDGTTLRDRARKFPSLINCCTVIYFDSWPAYALLEVAEHFLEHMSPRDLSN